MKKKIIFLLLISFILGSFSYAQSGINASFIYEYGGWNGASGVFKLNAGYSDYSFETSASAGYVGYANNPYLQWVKNRGPLPSGTWYITGIKNYDYAIIKLTPSEDVELSNRHSFLIHGKGKNKTIEESSHGCIIITDIALRRKIRDAYKKYGSFPLYVKAYVSDSGQG
ncbi:MAG: tlde1 domain-containing protein [Spirochaetota bacterium]